MTEDFLLLLASYFGIFAVGFGFGLAHAWVRRIVTVV